MDRIREAADIIAKGKHVVAFTGAGISVESGIPPFRGKTGLWSKYDPGILDLSMYFYRPGESWPVIYELFYQFFGEARPNPAHFFLAKLENANKLSAVITQNIDNLHQEAGSKEVIEYHGNSRRLVCLECGRTYASDDLNLNKDLPLCEHDHAVLKPDFVFFGESIPEQAVIRSTEEAGKADVMIVIGTTGEVMPASLIPRMASNNGATIIEINPEETVYTESITNIFLQGEAGEVCTKLANEMNI